MNWEELVEKAVDFGYKATVNVKECEEEELWNESKGLCFFKNGKVCYWSIDEYCTIAIGKTYDEMYKIMKLLK